MLYQLKLKIKSLCLTRIFDALRNSFEQNEKLIRSDLDPDIKATRFFVNLHSIYSVKYELRF